MTGNDWLWLIPAFPALGVLINGLLGIRFGERRVALVAVCAVALAEVTALAACGTLLGLPSGGRVLTAPLYTWLAEEGFLIRVGLLLDPLSLTMTLVVLTVGLLIHIYSASYMKGDPGFRRFFVYLNLFVFFMLMLVLADNLVLTFVGWEGVGLCSYFLIGFWHERTSACDAGRKAFVVNRIGDLGYLLGVFTLLGLFSTVNYRELALILEGNHGVPQEILAVAALLLLLGAMGKSAQFPLHVWLPDAMEGPTPVSALIHAATMVNAGVYLLCRMSPLLEQAPIVLPVIAAVGLITAVHAALSAFGQTDIKRVLAYSTVSQIGYMFFAVGCGLYAAGIFHLVAHGIFKGLLFLAAGAIIHALHGEQALERMGGLHRDLKAVTLTFLIGLLALSGIFPLAGFFSKDAILIGGMERYGWAVWAAAFIGALLTALYCGKLLGALFGKKHYSGHLHPAGALMTVPLVLLAAFALVAGLLGLPLFTKETFMASFLGLPLPTGHAAGLALEIAMTLGQLAVIGLVLYLAGRLFIRRREAAEAWAFNRPRFMGTLLSGLKMDAFYEGVVVKPFKVVAVICAWLLDKRLIDGIVNGTGVLTLWIGERFSELQTGTVRVYALSMLGGAVLFLWAALSVAGSF